MRRDFCLSLSLSLHDKYRRVHMDLIFFFPRPFILTYRHVFFPSLSPLLQRGRSKATLCSFRKAACSTTFTIRRNAGNLTGKQTDEKGREDEATWEYRFTCSPQRNSIHRWSSRGFPVRWVALSYRESLVISEWMNFLGLFWIFLFFLIRLRRY